MSPITAYNPFDAAVKANPYPYYDWLRREHPVYHNARFDIWALSRYEDVEAAAHNPEVFSSAQGVGPDRTEGRSMLVRDPPAHTRLRKLVSKAFTPRRVELLAPRIQAILDELIEAVLDRGSFDLIQDIAYPLPVIVIAEMLGIPPEHRDDFKRWSDDLIHSIAGTAHGHPQEQIERSWEEVTAYLSATIESRRRAPRDDLITALVQAQEERDALTPEEVLGTCILLLVAGNETTTNLIGNGALALFSHPEQAQKLRQRPELVNTMVEEVLRFDAPIQAAFRTTTRAIEVRGITIPADSKVALLYASANRDPQVFAEPDRFDIERTPNRHLAFGTGIHFCLGAPLARLEARLATETLLRRMKNLAPAPDGVIDRIDNPLFRGLRHYPLVFEAV
jgi:cytochrome P450